jgi:hypothetical protein
MEVLEDFVPIDPIAFWVGHTFFRPLAAFL